MTRTCLRAVVCSIGLTAILMAGCQAHKPLPYVPKDATAPPVLVCHDAIGHAEGNKPWILGGNCCCTPTRENYDAHIAAGTLEESMTYEDYLQLYKEMGVATDLDHTGCGNLCEQGPHVVLGGSCMATPTPGTRMYEQVTYGPHEDLMAPKPVKK